jgi:hypothetical protein
VKPARVFSGRSEPVVHPQAAGRAVAFAVVALQAEIDGEQAVGRGAQGEADFEEAGVAFDVRGVD